MANSAPIFLLPVPSLSAATIASFVAKATFDLAMKNQVNAMNAAWGGQWDSKEIMISMGSHAITDNLARCGEFTVADFIAKPPWQKRPFRDKSH